MNGRKLYREFAQSKGKEAKEFDKIERGFFTTSDTLHTKDNNGYPEQTPGDNTISVIDLKTLKEVEQIPVGTVPRRIALSVE